MIQHRANHQRESGGITIILALILLTTVTVAAFGLGRTSLREIMITGNESTGRKAFETADSGLDWVITWGSPYATTTTGSAAATLHAQMSGLISAIDTVDARTASYMDPDTGTMRVHLDSATIGDALTPSRADWLQFTKGATEVVPAFDLEVRYLGPNELANTGRGALIKSNRSLWLVRSTGRANIGTTGQSFVSRREAIVEYIN
ncbi:PilX N-terminal domain-containing pilus assembly protein [Geothrix edaphica]|uniref:Type 4 fimbrial biogenesis protein PilX N-terminal domain-containing protein n=1 Tax=Geothrix edaphica TaxID=2927976 RepID=A0ABQ5PZ78_9BACT|nr:PilX N-terminal domain-containing pilus assembly protein [Geothrix edaphica]GLH67765.1 hypothetical protein GETHED_21290 [Geothrix edaphica]